MSWKMTFVVFAVSVGAAIVLMSAQGVPWYVGAIACGVLGIVLFVSTAFEHRANASSFGEAEKFKAGYAFKDPREEQRFAKWAAKHRPIQPMNNMRSDLIARYRAPRIAVELFGVLALGIIEIVLFKEKSEGRGEPAVIYIVLGGMILLLYLAIADIVGLKARRFYNKLSDLPEYANLERSYTEGVLVGIPRNYINIGERYVFVIVPQGVFPVAREHIIQVRRADILTAYYTNSVYTGKKDTYLIKIFTDLGGNHFSVRMSKFDMLMAYEVLKASGVPADDTIDMKP